MAKLSAQNKRMRELITEIKSRQVEALKGYRPTVVQQRFHASLAAERIARGGKRCQPDYTTVWMDDGTESTLAKVSIGDKIIGVRKYSSGKTFIRPTRIVDKKEFPESAYRLTTKRGYTTDGTFDHPVLACPPLPGRWHNSVDPDRKNAQWVQLKDVQPGWFVSMAFGKFMNWTGKVDETAYFHGLMDGDGSVDCYDYGVMKLTGHRKESLCGSVSEMLNESGVYNRMYRKSDNGVSLEWCNKSFKEKYLSWTPSGKPEELAGWLRGFFDAEGCVTQDGKIVVETTDIPIAKKIHRWFLMFGIRSSFRVVPANPKNKRPNPSARIQVSGCSVKRYAKSIGFSEATKSKKLDAIAKCRRNPGTHRRWWDRVRSVEKLEEICNIIGIETEDHTYISDGVVSHNSGKTVCASAEFASAVTGIDIIGVDGNPIPRKYPKRNMLAWVIGWDWTHIGQTIHRVLFEPGYFNMIPDENNPGEWRALNPAIPEDEARMDEAVPAGPMIPERLIISDSWSWENRAEKMFKSVCVKTPWGITKICAYPSTAQQAKQGDPVDLIWIDEDICHSEHVKEFQDRLPDRKGRLIWSAWPHGTNDALVQMIQRAQEQEHEENPDIIEIQLRFSDNPFIEDNEKRKTVARMTTEEDRRSRDFGDLLLDTISIYQYMPAVHNVQRVAVDSPNRSILLNDPLNDIYTKLGRFPSEWTRYLSIDPSHTRSAVLFGVVPPPSIGEHDLTRTLIIEDELVMKKASAFELAKAIRDKVGTNSYEAFIMDYHMGRQTRVGDGVGHTVMMIYQEAFERLGIRSRQTGSGFLPSNDNVLGRIAEIRDMMHGGSAGNIRLRFAEDRTPHLQKEFGTYRKKRLLDDIRDEPANAIKHDCMVAMEYLGSYIYNCQEPYVDPDSIKPKSPAYRRAQELKKKWKKQEQDYCHVGPGSAYA
jgi:hypothetical protein